MTACPNREMALHALVDGELDSLSAVMLENHLRDCHGCREALAQIEAVRALFAHDNLKHEAPQHLRDAITALIPPETTPRHSALPWLGGGAIGALAASLVLMLALPQLTEGGIAQDLVSAQIRSLQADHLTDVVTSDRHVVKPWFNGRIDFSPPVVDLAPQGFPLVGGRLDYVGGRDVAAIVYRRRLHTINLFVRPVPMAGPSTSVAMRVQSYRLVRWVSGGLEFWAVSDIDEAELAQFRDAFIARTQPPA